MTSLRKLMEDLNFEVSERVQALGKELNTTPYVDPSWGQKKALYQEALWFENKLRFLLALRTDDDIPSPDFATRGELVRLASRVDWIQKDRERYFNELGSFYGSLAETHQAYVSSLADSAGSPLFVSPERLTISRAVAEVLDIIIRANKESGA